MDRDISKDNVRILIISFLLTIVISLLLSAIFTSLIYWSVGFSEIVELTDYFFFLVLHSILSIAVFLINNPLEMLSLSVSALLTGVLAFLYYNQSKILEEQKNLEEAKHDPILRVLDYKASDREGYIEVWIKNVGGGRAENLQIVTNLFVAEKRKDEEISHFCWKKLDGVYLSNTEYYDYGIKEEKNRLVSAETLSQTSEKVIKNMGMGGVIKRESDGWYAGVPVLGTEIYRESEEEIGLIEGLLRRRVRGSDIVQTGKTPISDVISDLNDSGVEKIAVELSVEYQTVTGDIRRDYLFTKIISSDEDVNISEIIAGNDAPPIEFFEDIYPINKPGEYVGKQF